MAIVAVQQAVGSILATQLIPLLGKPNQGPRSLNDPFPCLIQNLDPSITVYLGGAEVQAVGPAAGYPLLAGAAIGIDVLSSDKLYGIASSGSITVALLVGRQ
jgi:hypothetical protein